MFENLRYINTLMNEAVEKDSIAGGSVAVIHKGETVYLDHFGYADRASGKKMSGDNLFRLFSLTKPITAAAAMLLLERGKIELRYPLKWFLPTFDNMQVLDENGLRPADRDITLGDLLTMTSGISYPGGTPSGMKMGEVWGRQTDAYENGGKPLSTRDFVLEMGNVPLAFTPGAKWEYGASADVMGAVIETVSGMKYSEFLKKEFFEPLGMTDTGFYIPEEKYQRLATPYVQTPQGNSVYTNHDLCITDYKTPPAFESGGAGLVSTIEDYSKFVKMLLGRGSANGVRILGRKTVELMATDCLTDTQRASLEWDSMLGQGYGNFMRVLKSPAAAGFNGSVGEYGWDGMLGCYFCIDPKEDLAFLYFVQQAYTGCTEFTRRLQNVVWGALE
ncbi:MAG: serine hydrolase [Oscillospiraceae bacterium]|nr:serine hydrolase [Oscillospiraceae bacterium]MDY6207697.1 serine hydrolase domain-containing protein [Oscillospiraceae bacterium]